MTKLKQALGRSEEQLSLSSISTQFSSSTTVQSFATTARHAARPDERRSGAWREAATPEINFAESDQRDTEEEGSSARARERSNNVVVGRSTSAELANLTHPFAVNLSPYLVANETMDGGSLISSHMTRVALF